MAVETVRDRFDVADPRTVGLVSGAHGVNELFGLALPPILPILIAEFDLTYTRAGVLVTAYFAMYAVLQLPAGAVADRLGGTRLVAGGMVVMGAGMALASLSPSYPFLLASVALSGAGGSTYHPAGLSLVSDVETDETAGTAMGVHELAGILGNVLAPALVGGVAAVATWRLALGVTAVLGLLYAGVFAVLSEPRSVADGPSRTDVATGVVPTGAESPERKPLRRRLAEAWRATRIPLAWWVLGLAMSKALFTLQAYGVRTYLTSFAVARTGVSTGGANAMFVLFLAGSALATVGFGALADRFDRLRLLAGAFLGAGVLVAATALVPASATVLFGWFFLLGVAVYASLPVVNTLVSAHSERAFSGSLFGVVQTASALGGAVSPVLFGALASRLGIQRGFPLVAVVCLVAGVGVLVAALRTE